MPVRIRLCALLVCATISSPLLAQKKAENAPGWAGEGKLTYMLSQGNSDTETLGSKAKAVYNGDRWRGTGAGEALNSSSKGERTAEKYFASMQLDLKFDQDRYLFTLLEHEDDRFSGFHYQTSLTAGFGQTVFDNDRHKLAFEAGPGYRRSEIEEGDSVEEEVVVRAAVDYRLKLSESTTLTEELNTLAGSELTVTKAVTELKTKINSTLSTLIGHDLKFTSDVPPGRAKTDSRIYVGLNIDF
ncbi:MAG: DUF481 domain-containing protein [Hahellaceae bacterium]|jgi:putative salt-induced outer membrane protein|nr:DUF481 domain-containing protein [Hahellaceae bacterium]